MANALNQFLKSHGARRMKAASLEPYVAEMTETVIPQIAQEVKAREQLAAEMRFVSPTSARKIAQKDG